MDTPRIHSTLAKYALHDIEVSDVFGARGRALVRQRLELLPPCTAYTTRHLLEHVERLDHQVREFEQQIRTLFNQVRVVAVLLWDLQVVIGTGAFAASS